MEAGKDLEADLPMAYLPWGRTAIYENTSFSSSELVHRKNLQLSHILAYENCMEKETLDQI